jgi:RHS repeat-associated protein
MTYDHLGRRTSLATGGETTFFHYVGGLLVAESDEDGDITATYAYAPEGGLLSLTKGADTYYYQTNAHGDVVSLTDDSGTVVNTYTYDPWGQVLSASETVTNPFRYAGYYYDVSIDLYYLWHRYYDPGTRRFMAVDLLAGTQGNPDTLNRYVYVRNNPLGLVDPTGLCAESGDRSVLGSIGASGGTSYGQDALEYWTDRYVSGDWWAAIPASAAALWTPDTWYLTASALAGALGANYAAPTLAARYAPTVGPSVERIVEEAEAKYPKLVKFGIQAHHVIPKYIGGARDGVQRLVPAPYHQLITNAFRAEAKYGKGLIYSVDEIADICAKVYARYPIDSFPIAP